MSLIGMMIKNAVVLLDEVNQNLGRGMGQYQAVKQAAISRLAPVSNAAATTVFGVIPLMSDQFWVGLAVTIMFGLAFGTVLTMLVVPVLRLYGRSHIRQWTRQARSRAYVEYLRRLVKPRRRATSMS